LEKTHAIVGKPGSMSAELKWGRGEKSRNRRIPAGPHGGAKGTEREGYAIIQLSH